VRCGGNSVVISILIWLVRVCWCVLVYGRVRELNCAKSVRRCCATTIVVFTQTAFIRNIQIREILKRVFFCAMRWLIVRSYQYLYGRCGCAGVHGRGRELNCAKCVRRCCATTNLCLCTGSNYKFYTN